MTESRPLSPLSEPKEQTPEATELAPLDDASFDPFGVSSEAAEDVPDTSVRVIVAKRARMALSPALPLVDAESAKHARATADSLNGAHAAATELRDGECAVLSVAFVPHPRYQLIVRRYLTGTSAHDSAVKRFYDDAVKYLVRRVRWEHSKGDAPPPKWREKVELKLADLDESQKLERKQVDEKYRAANHYRAAIDVVVASPELDADQLRRLDAGESAGAVYNVGALESTLRSITTALTSTVKNNQTGQRLEWDDCATDMALAGHLDIRGDDRAVMTAGELSMLAHASDDTTHLHGVIAARSAVKHRLPKFIYTIRDPRNPFENGVPLIPIGILNKGSDDERIVGMTSADADKHVFICGQTGSGKSEALQWQILAAILDPAQRSIFVLDPHGELIADTLYNIIASAPERIRDVLLADLSDVEYPVGINPLDVRSAARVQSAVDGIMDMAASQLGVSEESATRGVPLTRRALKAMAEANLRLPVHDKLTLLQVPTFFTNETFRELVMTHCTREDIIDEFGTEGRFNNLSPKQQAEYSAVPIRIFGKLSESTSFANVFGSSVNKLDYDRLVAERRIVLVSAGGMSANKALGEFATQLGIPAIIAASEVHGRQRSDILSEVGTDGVGIRCFIDEAPAVIKQGALSVMRGLAELRKRDFGFVFAAQYIGQFDPALVKAIIVNTLTKITFAVPVGEAGAVIEAIDPSRSVTANDVASLPSRTIYANVQLDGGKRSGVFSADSIPPGDRERTPERLRAAEAIIRRSRAELTNSAELMDLSIKGQTNRLIEALRKVHETDAKSASRARAPRQAAPPRPQRTGALQGAPETSQEGTGATSADNQTREQKAAERKQERERREQDRDHRRAEAARREAEQEAHAAAVAKQFPEPDLSREEREIEALRLRMERKREKAKRDAGLAADRDRLKAASEAARAAGATDRIKTVGGAEDARQNAPTSAAQEALAKLDQRIGNEPEPAVDDDVLDAGFWLDGDLCDAHQDAE